MTVAVDVPRWLTRVAVKMLVAGGAVAIRLGFYGQISGEHTAFVSP